VTVLNPDGSVKGDGTLASSSYGMAYLFQGGRIDPATGFYLFGIRDDDPATGTWKEQDPDGYVNGANRYQMEAGSPSTFVDPSGLFLQTAAPLVGETVGGAAVPVLIAGTSVAIVIDGSAWGYEAYEYHQFAQPLPGYPVPPQPTSQPASPASQPSSPTGDPNTGAQPSNQQKEEPPPAPDPDPTPDRNPDDSPDVPSGQESGSPCDDDDGGGDDGSGATGTANGERAGKDFTPKGKQEVKDANAAANGGQTTCNNCGTPTTPAQKSQSGVTPSPDETQVDHIIPKSEDGDGSPSNGQVLCRRCNRAKSNQ
jgi:RHS repeat-associated protein